LRVRGVTEAPLVFRQLGIYEKDGKRKTAFARGAGAVYFRHGAKSEPATTEDLRNVIGRRVEDIRNSRLGGIMKLVTAQTSSS
jgi:hypothetical protein